MRGDQIQLNHLVFNGMVRPENLVCFIRIAHQLPYFPFSFFLSEGLILLWHTCTEVCNGGVGWETHFLLLPSP